MLFKELRTGEAFKYKNKLYLKLNLPIPSALNVKEGNGKVVRFDENNEVEKVIVDICVTRME